MIREVRNPSSAVESAIPRWNGLRGRSPAGRAGASLVALLALLQGVALAQTGSVHGVIQFSNGESMEGELSLVGGKDLQLHNGADLRSLPLRQLRQIRIEPETESLEQKWLFPEAGKTRKEKYGLPYPVRYLCAHVVMDGSPVLTGHLYTAAIFVDCTGRVQKVILPAKQRGTEGQTLADVVYPTRIDFAGPGGNESPGVPVIIDGPGTPTDVKLAVLIPGSLARFEARRGPAHALHLPPGLGAHLFPGVMAGESIRVGWPGPAEPAATAQVKESLNDARDFFDRRDLIAVYVDTDAGDIYSLMMLTREGKTTLDASRSQPWRCAIWRWKRSDDGRMLIAGSGYLFRGISEPRRPPPKVTIESDWWVQSFDKPTTLRWTQGEK